MWNINDFEIQIWVKGKYFGLKVSVVVVDDVLLSGLVPTLLVLS